MFDSKTLGGVKKIDVEGSPDGMLQDDFNNRVYVLSHREPNVTVLDAKDGAVLGTIDLGGAPEQAVSDGKGHIYIDIEDKDNIAVVDAKTMKVTAHYDISSKGRTCAGSRDGCEERHSLCRVPQASDDGDSKKASMARSSTRSRSSTSTRRRGIPA